MSFKNLKKNSGSVAHLTAALEKLNSNNNSKEDTRFWKLDRDKAGNGFATIRFLPAPEVDGEDALPWVRIFDHGFKGPTGLWYIENSLTTIGQQDPVSESNSVLWNSGVDENKKIAQERKRRLHFISNIMVISDSKHPENEGKVFLFKYGKKIFDKINLAMHPEFEDEKPVNPFDFWKGANFKLKVRGTMRDTNYDSSSFEAPDALLGGDDGKLEKLYKQTYSLTEFLAPKNFKSYDELKKQLEKVIGADAIAVPASESKAETATPKAVTPKKTVTKAPVEDDDEDLDYFKKLADD